MQLDFLYSSDDLHDIANQIIHKSLQMGATDAQVEISENISNQVEVLNQELETFETSHENQLTITLFKQHKKSHIGITRIDLNSIDKIIQQGLEIANYTQEDPHNGLLEKKYLVNNPMSLDLGLYNPINLNHQELIKEVLDLEQLGLAQTQISSSDGAAISLNQYSFVIANSNGLNQGYKTSRYSKSISLIGTNQRGMQSDYWYNSNRDYHQLASNLSIAEQAAQRVQRKLININYHASKPKIIFENSIAKSLIGSLIAGLSGSNLYRQLSFLNNSFQQQIFPEWFNLHEDPFVFGGLASCYFDNEGSQVTKSQIISNGKVNHYFLSSYSARKMNLAPTGNAGGCHNLFVEANLIGNLDKLIQIMKNGIIIIDTFGNGLNLVTGDYSVGAGGLIVENGEILGYSENLTISGNLRDIFQNILYVNNNYNSGHIQCGDMLINAEIIQVSSN